MKTPLSQTADLNLDFYRKRAKALLKAARAGDPDANARLKRHSADTALHAAQLAIAREQGFASWPRFQAFVTESRLDFRALVDRFIGAALSDGRRARDILADHPQIADAGVYVALVLGDWEKVADAIATDPDFVTQKSGPEGVEPIIYVCFSRFGAANSPRAGRLALTLRLLLAKGADPDSALAADHGPLSCLYAVSGLNNNIEMTRILLDTGADPNDNESLYHATEHADLAALKLLLEAGARPNGTNALKHMLDREDPEGVRLLLEAGANPNESDDHLRETTLHWAVRRGRSAEVVGLLLDHGADIDAVRVEGRTAYAMAVVGGQTEVAALLAARGADTRLSAFDAFVTGNGEAAPPESASFPGNSWMLIQLAEAGNVDAVAAMLKAGVPIDARGGMGETALHWACWKGNVPLMRLLMARGAPLAMKERNYGATPAGWLHHGAINYGQGDYAGGACLLIAAGVRDWDAPSGNPDMDAVLSEAGII